MKPPSLPLLLFLLLTATISAAPSLSPTPTPTPSPTKSPIPRTPSTSSSPLDPKQLKALESLNIPTVKNPCDNNNHRLSKSSTAVVTCDAGSPFRLVTSISFKNCSSDLSLSSTALRALSPSLTSLSFLNCPSLSPPPRLPDSLHSFTAVSSFTRRKGLTGVFLARLVNLTDLTVTSVPVSTSGLFVILGNMHKIVSLTISHANLSGNIPKSLHSNLTFIDLSDNLIKGSIPTSITLLSNLKSLNLSQNSISGEIPDGIGDLISLKNLSLASNKLSGPIPDSISSIPELTHLDLSGNQLNGTVPKFISKMKNLKHLNLANNAFHGVLPFNASFLKKLEVFKIGGNSDLCYNHTALSTKMKLGIAKCDKHGLPLSPPPQKDDSSSSDYDYGSEDDSSEKKKEDEHHGPNKVVLGVAIGLSSLVFLIIFLILLAKWCG